MKPVRQGKSIHGYGDVDLSSILTSAENGAISNPTNILTGVVSGIATNQGVQQVGLASIYQQYQAWIWLGGIAILGSYAYLIATRKG